MKFKNLVLWLGAALITLHPGQSLARTYQGALDDLIRSLKVQGVEVIDPSFKLDPSLVFMQLYTDGAVTQEGKVIDKGRSNVDLALKKAGFNPEEIAFVSNHFSDLAFINTGMNYALVTGDLKQKINEGGLDQRVLFAGHPDSLVARGLLPLTTEQANTLYGMFYAGINRDASALREFEKGAEVSVPVIDNSGRFQGQVYSLLSLLAFRPFDASSLKHQMIDKLGIYEHLMNSWEDARRAGFIETGKGKIVVSLSRKGQNSLIDFYVVSKDGRLMYKSDSYNVPLEKAWQQAGAKPRGEYANLAEIVDKYITGKPVQIVENDLGGSPVGVKEDSTAIVGATQRDSLRNDYKPEVGYTNGTLHPSEENAFDIGLGVSNLGVPQASAVFWLNRRLGLSIGAGFGGNAQDESSWEESVSGANDIVKRSYTSKGSPGVLEALMGVEGRYKGLRYGVQAGVEKRQGDYRLRVDEERRGKDGVLKGRGSSEKTELQKFLKPDIRAGIGWVHDGRFGVKGFVGRVGRSNKYYGGAKIIIGVY